MSNLFIKATRCKFRYPSQLGALTTEDLWDIPLRARAGQVSLNSIAKTLHKEIESSGGDIDFVDGKESSGNEATDKLDIVKEVIDHKKKIEDRTAKAAATRQKKQRIMQIIEQKEDASLLDKDIDELKKLMDSDE